MDDVTHSLPLRIARHADIQGNIEEESLHLAAAPFANQNIWAALVRGKISGVDISDGAPRGYPLAQEIAKRLEDAVVNGLIGLVVG